MMKTIDFTRINFKVQFIQDRIDLEPLITNYISTKWGKCKTSKLEVLIPPWNPNYGDKQKYAEGNVSQHYPKMSL